MSEIKNDGLDQYGAKRFEQQQFGTAGVEGVNHIGIVEWFRWSICWPCLGDWDDCRLQSEHCELPSVDLCRETFSIVETQCDNIRSRMTRTGAYI